MYKAQVSATQATLSGQIIVETAGQYVIVLVESYKEVLCLNSIFLFGVSNLRNQ